MQVETLQTFFPSGNTDVAAGLKEERKRKRPADDVTDSITNQSSLSMTSGESSESNQPNIGKMVESSVHKFKLASYLISWFLIQCDCFFRAPSIPFSTDDPPSTCSSSDGKPQFSKLIFVTSYTLSQAPCIVICH